MTPVIEVRIIEAVANNAAIAPLLAARRRQLSLLDWARS